jgi:uncharacterized damage-inducible protein DinB
MNAVPYSHVLAGRDPQPIVEETPARLARVLDALTPAQIETPPAPGKWSVREITAHLADCEIAWGWRLRQAYASEHHQIQPFDQDAWARSYAGYTFAEARTTFNALRAWNIIFIAGLSDADKQRPVTHPERGEETLWTIVKIMAGHDLHHLERLESLLPNS